MTFRQAVSATPELQGAYCSGLQALREVDRRHVDAENTRLLKGSVDLDTTLKDKYPKAPRWDYAIGHHPTNLKKEMVYWVEIHPATTGEVNAVLGKLRWLKEWLGTSAPDMNSLHREYVWLSSGKTAFTLSAPQLKQVAESGLSHKGRVLKIPDKAVA